jgi:hypothetical protein
MGLTPDAEGYRKEPPMRFSRFLSKFELDAMFRLLPHGASIAPVSVSGFTSHKTQMGDLPQGERDKVHAVADRIVNGFRTGLVPVVGVLLVGHADQDLAGGTAFEHKISVERAERVREALIAALQARAGGSVMALQVKEAALRTVGVGASQRVNTHPVNEAQRAANRRVVMFIAESSLASESLFGEKFPVPRQKQEGAGAASPPPSQRPSALLAFSVPVFGAPPLAGSGSTPSLLACGENLATIIPGW